MLTVSGINFAQKANPYLSKNNQSNYVDNDHPIKNSRTANVNFGHISKNPVTWSAQAISFPVPAVEEWLNKYSLLYVIPKKNELNHIASEELPKLFSNAGFNIYPHVTYTQENINKILMMKYSSFSTIKKVPDGPDLLLEGNVNASDNFRLSVQSDDPQKSKVYIISNHCNSDPRVTVIDEDMKAFQPPPFIREQSANFILLPEESKRFIQNLTKELEGYINLFLKQ